MADTLGQASYAATRNPFNYDKIEQIGRDLTTNWLTAEELTQQLNLFGDESQDDYLMNILEPAIRMHLEDYLGVPFFPMQFRTYYGVSSLYASPVCLDLPEVSYKDSYGSGGVTINSVKFYNGNTPSTIQTLSANQYYYDQTGNKVILTNGLPQNLSENRTSPIIVEYTLAPNFLQAYPVIKHAGLLLATHLYNNRSDTTYGKLEKIPFGVDALLRPYKPLVM